MQFKLIATFLLSAALASANDAVRTATEVASSGSSGSSETTPDSSSVSVPAVPHSILTALESAIPSSFYTDILHPEYRSSLESEIMAGTMPAWYNKLPKSVIAWASSEGGLLNNLISPEPTSAAVGAASSNAPATGVSAHNTAASTMSTAASTTTGASGANASGANASGPSASGSSASGSKKPAPSSSTSTGGAPIATGGVAAGIAGIAGILGLALAL